MIKSYLLIGLGGALGAIMRYSISGWVQRLWQDSIFPFGTLVVNIFGCLLIGLLSQLAESRNAFPPETRVFLFIGVLGGFTTFSTFGNESFNLFRDGQNLSAFANLFFHIFLGLSAIWLGRYLAGWIWR